MNARCHWDEERSMTAINAAPYVQPVPTPEEMKEWMGTGKEPNTQQYTDDRERCPTCGRAWDCECSDCQFCIDGTPRPDLWSEADVARWGADPQGLDDLTGTEDPI